MKSSNGFIWRANETLPLLIGAKADVEDGDTAATATRNRMLIIASSFCVYCSLKAGNYGMQRNSLLNNQYCVASSATTTVQSALLLSGIISPGL